MANRPKTLIVDDDPGWLKELVPLLRRAGYEVETASSFDIARNKLIHTMYAVIIVDLELEAIKEPHTFEGFGLLSGIQFLESLERGQGKAIVLSAYKEAENVRQAFRRGAYDFVFKQEFDESKFLGIVKSAIDLWMSHRISVPELRLSPEEERQYERLVHQFIKAKGVRSLRDLTPEEEKEFRQLTRRFMSGEPITLDVPEDAVNPWAHETGATE
jgi:DNA-binding NtrC family response regulator